MMYALYFHSRKYFHDRRTWGKEKLPADWTSKEVEEAARLAGVDGYAIVELSEGKELVHEFKWFVE